MVHVYLVGTHHLDLKGPERLKKFLDWTRPDAIGLEATIEQAQIKSVDDTLIRAHLPLFKRRLSEKYGAEIGEHIVQFLNIPCYEISTPLDYLRVNPDTKLIYCDKNLDQSARNSVRRALQGPLGGNLTEANEFKPTVIGDLAKTDFQEYQKGVDAIYDNLQQIGFKEDPELFQQVFIDRDEYAETKIREVLPSIEHNFVYIGGAGHFFRDYSPNLYDRLRDLNPIRLKLKDVDNF